MVLFVSIPFYLSSISHFLKEVRRGRYGGVIGDNTGMISCSYSVWVDCTDSNVVDSFTKLIICRELQKLSGHNAIIEGDSFSAIQWGVR